MTTAIRASTWVWLLVVAALLLGIAQHASTQPQDAQKLDVVPTLEQKHRVGRYVLTVPGVPVEDWLKAMTDLGREAGPDLVNEAEAGRLQWIPREDGLPLTFQVHVPQGYVPAQRHGVVVFINSSNSGTLPAGLASVLEQHKLIGIGADASGNKIDVAFRIAAALQGLKLIKDRYDLDPQRIYITGTSGGGRVASMMMLQHCDTFTGGFPHIGANAYMDYEYTRDDEYEKSSKPGFWRSPVLTRLERAREQGRFAFLTGEKDFNRAEIKAVADLYQRSGFKHVGYFEQPGLAHAPPNAAWFSKAIEFLDAPLAQDRK